MGKRFRRRRAAAPGGLKDALAKPAGLPSRILRFVRPERGEWFWALRNVSFEAHAGELIGIVGSNGVGKSSLLKMVSRIIPPSEGTLEMRGRVSSLLEAGAAFHPELTGRENIQLGAAISGMTRREIAERFDAIVEFAGVGNFIETPLKHYSTGMYLRLAFAVAAHLPAEIVVVDEILSVADASFRESALERIRAMAREGTLVLFVSHNLRMVREVCSRTLLLERGTLAFDGPTNEALARYGSSVHFEHTGTPGLQLTEVRVNGELEASVEPTAAITASVVASSSEELAEYELQVLVLDADGEPCVRDIAPRDALAPIPAGSARRMSVQLPAQSLSPGEYGVEFILRRLHGAGYAHSNRLFFRVGEPSARRSERTAQCSWSVQAV